MTRTPAPDNELTQEIAVVQGTQGTATNCGEIIYIGLMNHRMETWRVNGEPTELPTAQIAVSTMEESVIAVAGQSWEVEGCYFELLEVGIASNFRDGYVRLKVTPINPP